MSRYDTIIKANLTSSYGNYENCYLLTGEDVDNELEVELTGDLFFNCDYKKENVSVVKKIESLQDLLDFCKENNIDIPEENIGKDFLIVGGSSDLVIQKDLEAYGIFDELVKNHIDYCSIEKIRKYVESRG